MNKFFFCSRLIRIFVKLLTSENLKRMKKIALLAATALLSWGAAAQQDRESEAQRGGSVSVDWMQPFSGVAIDGPMRVKFVRVTGDEPMKISYDTRSSAASRVKASVDKAGVLNIREKSSREQVDTTHVTVYYRRLERLTVAEAEVSFAQPIVEPMVDVSFSGGARVDAAFDVRDLVMNVTGKCRISLSGAARYFDLTVSTALVDAFALKTMSARVDASHGAVANVQVDERLEAYAASAKVYYTGAPEIVRGETSAFGGDIVAYDGATHVELK